MPEMPPNASWRRRILALFIDWGASWLVTIAVASVAGVGDPEVMNWLVLVVFWVESSIGVAWGRASVGQLLANIRVLPTDQQQIGLFRAMLRAFLVCLVIPPLVFKPDGRGLHDLATRTGTFVPRE